MSAAAYSWGASVRLGHPSGSMHRVQVGIEPSSRSHVTQERSQLVWAGKTRNQGQKLPSSQVHMVRAEKEIQLGTGRPAPLLPLTPTWEEQQGKQGWQNKL